MGCDVSGWTGGPLQSGLQRNVNGPLVLQWVLFFPLRVLRLVFRYPLAILQGVAMTCFDLVWPTLTLAHGTDQSAANAIAQSGQWVAGMGDWVGTGIYFGLSTKTAQTLRKIRKRYSFCVEHE